MIEQLTFLEEGKFTQRDDLVKWLASRLSNSNLNPWHSVSEYVAQKLKYDDTNKYEVYRQRTASEIINSGFVTGCTDVGLAFIVLSRELGIPTRYVETFEEKWLLDKDSCGVSGHIFLDVKINDSWHAYEPIRGFTKDNDYVLRHGKYIEVGKGLDFSKLYLKDNGGYSTQPMCLQSLSQMRKLAISLDYSKK